MEWLKRHRNKILLLLILLLTAFLAGYKIWEEGDGNAYYTATVRSMLTSWHNFFYASFDPGGFITVDKPALGFWLQCLFGLVFGVSGWSLILPEVLCAVVSVAILYHIVKRSYGPATGLLAALFLALTPIFIAASRSNNLDASLVMVCLFAVWAVVVAAEKGSLKHLLLAAALIGLGFNIKMLQAYLYLPALFLVYLFTANIKMKKRIAQLAIAAVVLLTVSFSWCIVVDLTPAAERPFVGSSLTNSELDLAMGYNGIARVLESNADISHTALTSIVAANTFIPNEGGQAGVLRFWGREMAGQASWMMTLAVFGILALLLKLLKKDNADKRADLRQLLLWGGLFAPMFAYFSISGHFHRYYLMMLAPCLAALGAIALREFIKFFTNREAAGKRRWQIVLLPAAIAVTAAVQIYILKAHYVSYSYTLVPVIIIGAALSIIGLVIVMLLKQENKRFMVAGAAAVGIVALLVSPAFWACCPILYGSNAAIPVAGPTDVASVGFGQMGGDGRYPDGGGLYGGSAPGGFKPGAPKDQPVLPEGGMPNEFHSNLPSNFSAFMGGGRGTAISAAMTEYMMAHYDGARFLVAVPNAAAAEPIIIKYGVGVMALGGFRGSDNAISLDGFIAQVEKGEIQYYWEVGNTYSPITKWVEKNAIKVELAQTNSAQSDTGAPIGTLYDLSGLKTAQ